MKSRYKSSRITIAIIIIVAIILGFAYDLYTIQIRDHDYYLEKNNTAQTYIVPIEAARGEICLLYTSPSPRD